MFVYSISISLSELEVISIFVRILIFGTVQICTVLNITKDLRILADKPLDIQNCLDIQDFEAWDIGGGIWTLEYP